MNNTPFILLFGGTTEGKAAANWLNDMGFTYYYSTKTATSFEVYDGCIKLEQALLVDKMTDFCKEKEITLIVDAAHPYARDLHWNIHACCAKLDLAHIRIERSFTDKKQADNVHYHESLDAMIQACKATGYNRILSLMGVKSVAKLHGSLDDAQVWYRILDRPLSWDKALACGVSQDKIMGSLAFDNFTDAEDLIEQQKIQVLLTKDSGHNGLFEQKVALAQKYQLPLLVLEQPTLPEFTKVFKCRAELRQYMEANYSLTKPDLAHGYTSGTCATICAKAAATLLLTGECNNKIAIRLPDGEQVSMPLHTKAKESYSAYATVIKNSGDDPDLMDGLVIGCRVYLNQSAGIRFVKGEGVGIVKLPGLGLPLNEPAVNKVPRAMIKSELERLLDEHGLPNAGFDVEVFIPQGQQLALKTFNPRLGIEGGLSIIGSTGRIKPFSSEVYVATIHRQLDVVEQNNADQVVFNSGGRSERYLKEHFKHLPPYCFVQYGNYIGEALNAASQRNIKVAHLGIMIGKAVKLAAGHLDTHSRNVVMDKDFLADLATEAGYSEEQIEQVRGITLARELEQIFPFKLEEPFFSLLSQRCESAASNVVEGYQLRLILINNEGEMLLNDEQEK
ncbi:cobalt-precorrin-5B (C(1))-methyltransferase [Carboxylicivirga sediminis]|uniref:Cobalt-precorrin-5B C(1)-methyltransferase n=1 Tax=Carboxylicivirga sediminis TaxID=2006564 RepID=A0A941F1Q5_9BACT|nr:cobalt-precorrin-5B (C(1))-methyltransferase CbiD [Carboxylicivirga sediminis]MBR8535136.1 cobalt-precorrin-5B (C(1))-methyltransferase [Carboxylicivirga sediminis]